MKRKIGLIGVLLVALLVAASQAALAQTDVYFKPDTFTSGGGTIWNDAITNTGGGNGSAQISSKMNSLCSGGRGDHGAPPFNLYFAEGTYNLTDEWDGFGLYDYPGGTYPTISGSTVTGGWYQKADLTWARDPVNHPTVINCNGKARGFSIFASNVVLDGFKFVGTKSVAYQRQPFSSEYYDNDVSGICVVGDNLTIKNCVLKDNVLAGDRDHAIAGPRNVYSTQYDATNIRVEDTDIIGWTETGGDMSGRGMIFYGINNLTVIGGSITNCTGPAVNGIQVVLGSGVGGSIVMDSVEISNNAIPPKTNGRAYGEIIRLMGGTTQIQNCDIIDNAVGINGGILLVQSADANLVNCVIADNDGLGLWWNGGNVDVTNCTVVNNLYGDVYAQNVPIASVVNSIIGGWYNDATALGNVLTVDYTLYGAWFGDTNNPFLAGTGNLTGIDPEFYSTTLGTPGYLYLSCDTPDSVLHGADDGGFMGALPIYGKCCIEGNDALLAACIDGRDLVMATAGWNQPRNVGKGKGQGVRLNMPLIAHVATAYVDSLDICNDEDAEELHSCIVSYFASGGKSSHFGE